MKEACYSPTNKFKKTAWDYHILSVVEYSLKLGRKLKADPEVLELAALLHDYSGILDIDLYKDHHAHSARLAEEILSRLDYPEEKTRSIQKAIFNHRGSLKLKRRSLEEKILASADAMTHITELADMFYLAYKVHGYETREGAEWLKKKLERSWKKIMKEGRELVKDDYKAALKIIARTQKI